MRSRWPLQACHCSLQGRQNPHPIREDQMIMAVGVTRSAQKRRQWQSHRQCVSGPQITGPTRAARPAVRETVQFADSGERSEKFSRNGPSPCTVVTWMFYPYWMGRIIETLFDGASPKTASEKF